MTRRDRRTIRKDYTGFRQRHGGLVVVRMLIFQGLTYAICACRYCGNEASRPLLMARVKNGDVKSCGCQARRWGRRAPPDPAQFS